MTKRGRAETLLDGFIVVDKEPGMTSHDVVGIVRRGLGERRVGHAGTLDPDATGVLVVVVGRATRLMRFVTGLDKAYVGTVVFGATTTTLDAGGAVTGRFPMPDLTLAAVRGAAATMTGTFEQMPPMVSAIKVGGRRLYELAREGQEVDRKPRPVKVTRFDIEATDDPLAFRLEVECSSGTYVRSLAADLGALLGGGAYLRDLRRTRVGRFALDGAIDARLVSKDDLRPAVELLGGLERVRFEDQGVIVAISHGSVLARDVVAGRGDGPWALLDSSGGLLAVYEAFGEAKIKPVVVHMTADSGVGQ